MERYSNEEQKITVLILLLVGLFILSSCGASMNSAHPRNITDQQAPFVMSGRSVYEKKSNPDNTDDSKGADQAQEIIEPSFIDGKPIYTQKDKTFEPTELIADFDSKHVSISTEVIVDGQKKALTLEGDFSSDGIAIVRSKQKINNKDISVGAVRCVDQCDSFIADIVVKKIDKDGKESYIQSQFKIPATKVDVRGKQSAILPKQDESTPKTQTSQDKKNITEVQTTANQPDPSDRSNLPTEPDSKEPSKINSDDNFEVEPTDGAASLFPDAIPDDLKINLADINDFYKPGVIPKVSPKEAMPKSNIPEQSQSEMDKIMKGVNLKIFPLNSDGIFSGRAVGCYSDSLCQRDGKQLVSSALIAGMDLTPDRESGRGQGVGFESIDLANYHIVKGKKVYDHVIYGSGLLLKHIEEVGKLYAAKYPGEKFETTNESVKGGGNTHHDLSHQNGLEVDVGLPKEKNGNVDCKKLMSLMTMWNSFHLVDRFYFDKNVTCSCLYPNAKTDQDKETLSKIYYWPGHKNHFHVRDKCTRHNMSCVIVKYDSEKKPIQCSR